MKAQKSLTGYRLHKQRILFSGGEVMRTIKYPLVPVNQNSEESKKFLKEFEEAVIKDDLKIRGDLNLNDYLIYTATGNTPYTLFDFWIDSLKAGVIWNQKTKDLIDFLNTKPVDLIWEKASSKITKYFEKSKFKEILKSIPVRKGKTTRKSFYQRLAGYLKNEFVIKNKDDKYEVTNPEIEKEINSIVDNFFDENDNLILDGKSQQSAFWKNRYNLDVSILQAAQPSGEYKDITFIIIPELILDLTKNYSLEELIVKRQEWLKRFVGDEKKIDSILCLTNNFNGFSNYLGKVLKGLQDKKIEEIFKAQKTIFPSIEENRSKVMSALHFLSEKAKLLSKVSMPLVNGWHDYRSVFGGKLQSWFSNSQKRKMELDGQIAKFKISLKQVKNYLQNEVFDADGEKEKKDILELVDILEQFFTNEEKSIKNEEDYLLFNSLLALVKRRLNFFYQAYIQKEGEETKVNNFKPFEGIYKKIYKPVAFYGDSARRANEKFVYKTIPILEDGIENVQKLAKYLKESFSPGKTFEKVKKDKEIPRSTYRKALQFFWNKYGEGMFNSSEFRVKCERILEENTDKKEWQELQKKENTGRYVYYKSPYAKGSLKEIKLKDQDSQNNEDYLEKLNTLYLNLVDDLLLYNRNKLLMDEKILLDWVELVKNVIGLLLRFSTQEEFELPSLALDNFHQAKTYIERFSKTHYSKNEYSFIIQSLIFSEIRGAATLYSKKDYIAKYSVQIVGSDSKFKLYYRPKDPGIILSKERKQLMQPHYFAVSLGENLEKKKAKNFNAIALGKNSLFPVFIADEKSDKLFRLSSSPYQLQFLDKFLYRPKGWEDIDITLSEWSFIVERRYKIQWDLNEKKPKLLPVVDGKEAKKNKLYIAIPFNLKPNKTKKEQALLKKIAKGKEKEEKDLSRLSYPILGVDVGEYGLAYCLARFDYDKDTFKIKAVEIVKDESGKPIYGFIADKNIANIKDKFAEIQQRAKQGAFDEEDTTVSRVRENAVGALRNKVHVIVVSGSSVVYEDSISNFETGSGRTTKIYNSVKRADTEHESKADEAMHAHVWGDKTKWVGRNVGAYASSYTCANCLHSLFQIKKEDLSRIKIIKKEGRIITMTSPYGEIKGYLSEKAKYEVGYQFKASELGLFRKIVEDFTRPPVGENSEVLNNFAKDLLEKNKIGELKKRRGNSAIFVCPFCHFVADADIQAAFMMAIRGYLRFSGIVPSKSKSDNTHQKQNTEKTSGESFLQETQKMLKDIDGTEIRNLLSLKL